MKKLMIAAAIVCAAALSQASVVEWGLGSAASIKIGDTTTKLGNQAIQLYLVGMNDAADVLFDSKSTLNSPANKKGTMAQSAGTMQSESGIKYNSTNVAGGNFWDSESGDLGREYYIKLTTVQGGKTYTYESSAIASSGLSDTALGKLSFTINSAVTDVAGTKDMWVAAVPEPTSGLLLLLGVAGLALRRRRA